MDRLISNYLSFPGETTAARLVRYANAHGLELCRAHAFDLGILAEASEVTIAARRARRLAERRAHFASRAH